MRVEDAFMALIAV